MPALRQAGGRCMWKEAVKLLPYGCFINIHMLNTFIRAVICSKCKGPSSPSWGIVVAYIGVRSWKLAQKSGKHITLDSPQRITLLPAYLALGFRHAINLEPGSHHSPAHLVSCSEQTQCNYLSQIAARLLKEGKGEGGKQEASGRAVVSLVQLQRAARCSNTAVWMTSSLLCVRPQGMASVAACTATWPWARRRRKSPTGALRQSAVIYFSVWAVLIVWRLQRILQISIKSHVLLKSAAVFQRALYSLWEESYWSPLPETLTNVEGISVIHITLTRPLLLAVFPWHISMCIKKTLG